MDQTITEIIMHTSKIFVELIQQLMQNGITNIISINNKFQELTAIIQKIELVFIPEEVHVMIGNLQNLNIFCLFKTFFLCLLTPHALTLI